MTAAHMTCHKKKKNEGCVCVGGVTSNARIGDNNMVLPNKEYGTYMYKEASSTESGELWTDICTDVPRPEATL